MACLRSAESVREFVLAVTSTEAAAGIYTLIRNLVQIYIDCYTDQCRSQCACFAFARRACWPCQQDSCNKITKNIETHLRTHFIGALCDPLQRHFIGAPCDPRSATKLVSPCEAATSLVPRVTPRSAHFIGAPCDLPWHHFIGAPCDPSTWFPRVTPPPPPPPAAPLNWFPRVRLPPNWCLV